MTVSFKFWRSSCMLDVASSVSSPVVVFEGLGVRLATGLIDLGRLCASSLGVFRLSGSVTGLLIGRGLTACWRGLERFKGRRYVPGSA